MKAKGFVDVVLCVASIARPHGGAGERRCGDGRAKIRRHGVRERKRKRESVKEREIR